MRQLILKLSKALGLFALSRRLTAGKLRILCYHGIWLGDEPLFQPALYMRAQTFERRMGILKRLGYPVLSLSAAVTGLKRGTLPANATVLTIDDGWYGTYRHMLPVLRREALPATIYVTTYYALKRRPVLNLLIAFMMTRLGRDGAAALTQRLEGMASLDDRLTELYRVAETLGFDLTEAIDGRWFDLMSEDEICDAAAQGVDIELHTHRHDLKDFSRAVVIEEVQENRRHLARILGREPETLRHFCYPSGVVRADVFPTLRALGVASATTTKFGLNDGYAEVMALSRLSDHEDMTDLEFEAQLCGYWSLMLGLKKALTPGSGQ